MKMHQNGQKKKKLIRTENFGSDILRGRRGQSGVLLSAKVLIDQVSHMSRFLGERCAAVITAFQTIVTYKDFYLLDCLLEIANMFLVLSLVYLLYGFQTHASPLAATSHNNATILSTSACICPADQRSILDILWSCLATIFACSWVSIHPNIPAPNESRWRILFRRLELMFWAVIGPEIIITWALRQWLGARHLEKLYKGELSSLIYNLSTNTKSPKF